MQTGNSNNLRFSFVSLWFKIQTLHKVLLQGFGKKGDKRKMKNERKEELKDEMKNRISLALKDPILQQGFEIICKENAELKAELSENKVADCHIVNGLCEQLTKAKEIINEFLDFESSCMERGIYISDKIRTEAKQFLQETDIDNAIQQANESLDFDKIADEMKQDLRESEVEK